MATNNSTPERIIVGITGASGVIYGIRALELLAEAGVETHLVISKAAELTMTYETDVRAADLRARASHWYAAGDIGAAISSGSFKTKGMLIVPCSVRSMSEIATGITSSLVSRETPLHGGHLRTLVQLSDMGAVIAPIVPAFYSKPQSIDDIVNHTVGRMLDLFDIETGVVKRWKEQQPER